MIHYSTLVSPLISYIMIEYVLELFGIVLVFNICSVFCLVSIVINYFFDETLDFERLKEKGLIE